jgi:DNA-3-methyladenine glycosylase II
VSEFLVENFDGRFENKLEEICKHLAAQDTDLQRILDDHGLPRLVKRTPSFETLVHIVLEQQISVQVAQTCFDKLKRTLGKITPETLLSLSDDDLKIHGFSRQKIGYVRHLAQEVSSGRFNIEALQNLDNVQVRKEVTRLKGFGDWSADVFLMLSLCRADIFPIGDLALINELKSLKNIPSDLPKKALNETLIASGETWRPYRTVATFLCWHNYLSKKT